MCVCVTCTQIFYPYVHTQAHPHTPPHTSALTHWEKERGKWLIHSNVSAIATPFFAMIGRITRTRILWRLNSKVSCMLAEILMYKVVKFLLYYVLLSVILIVIHVTSRTITFYPFNIMRKIARATTLLPSPSVRAFISLAYRCSWNKDTGQNVTIGQYVSQISCFIIIFTR